MKIDGYVVHIVDDEEPVRKSLAFLLTMTGFTVRVHDSATSFLRTAPNVGKACLVTDLRMPDMNGVEVARRIRALRPGLRLIFASGFADTDAIHAVSGPDAIVLRKPFRVDELLRVIARPGASGSD